MKSIFSPLFASSSCCSAPFTHKKLPPEARFRAANCGPALRKPCQRQETNYLNQLALRGFQSGIPGTFDRVAGCAEHLRGTQQNIGFNPASVIKVATSFAALYKFGPEYHFETSFYADGTINKRTRTLNGNLVLQRPGILF